MGPRSGDRGNGDWSEPGQLFHMASMGPRSGDRGNNSTRPWSVIVYGRLQWGRDLVIAEIGEYIDGTIGEYWASMGPRSGDRGNLRDVTLVPHDHRLQWGRDLVIAEIPRITRSQPSPTMCFNGAAIW